MSLVHNERTKLSANWLNALAAGIVITGVIAPVVATIYGVPGPSQVERSILALVSLVWFTIGFALHLFARKLLTRLRP